tara:strand:+ start:348 stop:599 length:252 start_codon:yes stop_codon:yes gene_type:complete
MPYKQVTDEYYNDRGHFYVVETTQCVHCGHTGHLEVPAQGLFNYNQGKLIQDCFPKMAVDLREQLITGIHPRCFEEMYAGWED